jgi:hypothetical protein
VVGEFGIEWRRAGTLMIGEPWTTTPDGKIINLPHRLIVPLSLWPEFFELLRELGEILNEAGVLDAMALIDEAPPPPVVDIKKMARGK